MLISLMLPHHCTMIKVIIHAVYIAIGQLIMKAHAIVIRKHP